MPSLSLRQAALRHCFSKWKESLQRVDLLEEAGCMEDAEAAEDESRHWLIQYLSVSSKRCYRKRKKCRRSTLLPQLHRRRYHGNLQLRRRRRILTYDTSYYEALSSVNDPTWYDADLYSHLIQDELDSMQSSMLSWKSPAEGERQHGSTPFSLRRKGPYFFDCEPSSPVASVTSELATPTLPRVNITKVYPALLRFLDVFYWQSQTLDRETLAWTR